MPRHRHISKTGGTEGLNGWHGGVKEGHSLHGREPLTAHKIRQLRTFEKRSMRIVKEAEEIQQTASN